MSVVFYLVRTAVIQDIHLLLDIQGNERQDLTALVKWDSM